MLVGLAQPINAVNQVGNVAETSRLLAFAVNRDRLPAQCLIDEIRQRAAIIQPHAGPIRVENPHDMRIHFPVPVVGHRGGFGKAFRLVVNASWSNRIHFPPIRFALRGNVRITIAFAGGSQQELGVLFLCQVQRVHCGD